MSGTQKKVSDFVQKHFVSPTNFSQFAQPKKHHEQQCVLVCQYLKGTGKRGLIVADTLLLMMFLGRANARDTK